MSRAISRESFNELKNYLGVYLQQGRVILDSDWNENQDIAVSFLRRTAREALGDGSPNRGFAADPAFPPPPSLILGTLDTTGLPLEEAIAAIAGACLADILNLVLYIIFGPLLFFLNFPGAMLEDFESLDGWQLSSTQGTLRIGVDRPFEGRGFLRLSGHAGTVTLTRTLPAIRDLSAFEMATFRYRLNVQTPGTFKFFIEDSSGNQSVWEVNNSAFARDFWLAGFAAPLDIGFRILTSKMNPAVRNETYSYSLFSLGGKTPIAWSVSSGALPTGLTLTAAGTDDDSANGLVSGTPTVIGDFSFTAKATDADGKVAERALTLKVKASGEVELQLPDAYEFLSAMAKVSTPTGTPANLARVQKYGFEVYQDSTNPLVWDFDDLRIGSSALQDEMGRNNFIVRGSQFSQFLNQLTLLSLFQQSFGEEESEGEDETLDNILSLINTDFQLSEPSIENAGRMYVNGLPCVQIDDVLYSDQADPNDPPLAPPPEGVVRKDTVYLDVWTEPVTYVEDPEIREVALGGPDTTTRTRVRHRVRVAQGGSIPTGNGIGQSTLATEGNYTGAANRLYLVEIDAAGGIGTATFRWSEDNASTIQRVIEPVPPGSTKVVVEDASAYHPGDLLFLRKEFGAEEHRVSAVFGNVITLQSATGLQLAALPAAARVADFTTFSLADRPRIERWNAFRVPIAADPNDSTISAAIPLNDGVQVRFGGRDALAGDYWNFQTRYLAGDEASGLDQATRIERLDFVRARGVRRHYAPIALITRDGSADDPDHIVQIEDRRQRVGNASTVSGVLGAVTALTGTAATHIGGLRLPPAGRDSKFVIFWSGDLFLPAMAPVDSTLTVRVSFYNDEMTDPATDPDAGKIQDRELTVPLRRKPVGVEVPLQLMYFQSDTSFLFLPVEIIPTSLQVFVELNQAAFTVELANMQVTAMELKKSY